MVVLRWVRWGDVGCGSLYVRHIRFDLSYDTAVLSFWRVLHFLFLNLFSINTTRCRVASIIILIVRMTQCTLPGT